MLDLGARLTYWDPYVDDWQGGMAARLTALDDLDNFDCIVLLQRHGALDERMLAAHADRVLDTRGGVRGAIHL